MRGTPPGIGICANSTGIIPAYAGNTAAYAARIFPAWDHPRVCGEHVNANTTQLNIQGSSPRMRGTHSANSLRNPWSGIIPAYAGNTSHQHAERRSAWDHPRVCGEHHGSGLYSGCAAGSSPRMRGTHRRGTRSETAQGIIPAYAGNTSQCAALRALLRDHPRVCGEHRSPVSWRIPPTRIIPAYAGNTRFAQQICCVYRDHPRVCGEHIAFVPAITVVVGSSPRMRGTLHDWPIQVVVEGIIPAYAGNTRCSP